MILAEVTFIPVGVGLSGSKYVKIALETFRQEGIAFFPNSMATVLEDESLERIMNVIGKAEGNIMEAGVKRLETAIKIDHRIDVENSVKRKLTSIGILK